MRNDSLSGRVCRENFNSLLMFFLHLIYCANYICWISINITEVAGEERLESKRFPQTLLDIYQLSKFALTSREAGGKGEIKTESG